MKLAAAFSSPSAVVALSVTLVVLLSIGLWIYLRARRRRIPRFCVLKLELNGGVSDSGETGAGRPAFLGGGAARPQLRQLVEALAQASEDPRVKGACVFLGGAPLSLAHVQELGASLAAFRAAGKFTVAYAETLGEIGTSSMQLLALASACEHFWLQPAGDVSFTGLVENARFLRGFLDKAGVTPEFSHRREYKAYRNLFMETHYTAAHKESSVALLSELQEEILGSIGSGRKLSRESLTALLETGYLTAERALEARLVDALKSKGEFDDAVKALACAARPKRAKTVAAGVYLDRRGGRYFAKGEKVALVYACGGIRRGRSSFNALQGARELGSDTMADIFERIRKDKKVKAVVVRVDSPGGSAVASDIMGRELMKTRAEGKPIVVSMGTVCASGGYWLSACADRIVAQPATITGSIGVVTGKLCFRGLFDKFGVTFDTTKVSPRGTMWSAVHTFDDVEQGIMEKHLDETYERFKALVSKGRSLDAEKVESVAKGRVWVGRAAAERGLVDVFGGLREAVEEAKKLVKIDAADSVSLEEFGEKRSLVQRLRAMLAGAVAQLVVEGLAPAGAGGVVRMILREVGDVSDFAGRPGAHGVRVEVPREARVWEDTH